MKASNPEIMVQAYRLLVNKMEAEKMNYPLHLGVTEAGGGDDGRIKSAAGIGTLLEDGLGDTIRVSLTEEPEAEVPVAIKLVERYNNRLPHDPIPYILENPIDPFEYKERSTYEIGNAGGKNVPLVILSAGSGILKEPTMLSQIGYVYDIETDKWNIGDAAPDYIYLGKNELSFPVPVTLKKIYDFGFWKSLRDKDESFPLFTINEYLPEDERSTKLNFV